MSEAFMITDDDATRARNRRLGLVLALAAILYIVAVIVFIVVY